MNWFAKALRQYADFQGRARRAEYWYFMLFYIVIFFVLSFLDGMLGMYSMEMGIGVLSGVFALAVFIPSLSVLVRRLHDIGRSGWWALIMLIPFIGAVVLLVFAAQDSQPGTNTYGPNPKTGGALAPV